MIYSSLALLAMATSALASPLIKPIHLHPHAVDPRVSVTLHNQAMNFRDVKVDGQSYTVPQHHYLTIKAPVGTLIYADSRIGAHRRGDVLLEITSRVEDSLIDLN